MATRMQQRRGTAAQWTSANPVLNAGEMGWESDTNKFKIGDGTNHWANIDYFIDANSTVNPSFGTSIVFEGATADSYETTLQVTDPTDDRTITLPNVSGTVITTGNLSDITDIGVFASTIVMEGSTANDFELTLSAGDPTADRTITFPDATGTVALTSDIAVTASSTNTFTNKSISLATNTVSGTKAEFNTAMSDADFATIDGTETLTNKTLTTPVISSITNSAATLTLPTSTGTIALTTDIPAGVVTESGTQTLTNKTLTSPKINEDVAMLATATELNILDGATLSTTELNYVDGVTSAIQTQLNNLAPKADPTFTGTVSAAALTLSGDLTVNGTTTTINSTTLAVDDKNIVLGDVETPTDTTADGGGITLKGSTDKTFNWVDATDAWTSSEHVNLLSGKELKIDGTSVLSGSTLGSGVTGSSLTSVGTITSGTWTGTTIAIANGGTGQTTASEAANALLPSQTDNSGKYLTTNGSGTLSWGTVSGYSAPTLGSTSISSGATVTSISGLTLSGATLSGSLTAGGGTGTSGQVLKSTGDGVEWTTPSGGAAFSEFMLIGA
jgi:hypothetical protein